MGDLDDIEALRQRNLKEREEFLASFMSDPSFAEAINGLKSLKNDKPRASDKQWKRKKGDSTFKFKGAIPTERRNSARLQNKKPDYSHLDLPDERTINIKEPDTIDDLEEVVYHVKKKRTPAIHTPAKIIPVEEVTQTMINNIQTSGIKVYGEQGSSCHQCRQKTVDTKTICRSGFCVGVRGQFCGMCVINRYGEDPVAALKDPNWKCYVCRNCCNCSFCRLKEGKRPTGILAPLAKSNGYKSVMDFLKSLKGYGDYADPTKDPDRLLGFKGNYAICGNGRVELKPYQKCDTLNASDTEDLLGFDEDFAICGQNIKVKLGPL